MACRRMSTTYHAQSIGLPTLPVSRYHDIMERGDDVLYHTLTRKLSSSRPRKQDKCFFIADGAVGQQESFVNLILCPWTALAV